MYGLELERGLDRVLGQSIIEYDPRRSVTLRKTGGRILQKRRVISPALIILKDKEADRLGAVDSICRFEESPTHGELPPIVLQYTLQLRNVDKLERFVRLAQFRGGKHLYVMVDPGNKDAYPYHLFVAARFLREELYALATNHDPNAIWIFHINQKYKVTVYREPSEVIARFKRRLEQRRRSKTRVRGEIVTINRGHGSIELRESGERLPFNFESVVDSNLRLVFQGAALHANKNLVIGLRVSCERRKDVSSGTVQAISILSEVDLAPIKRRLYETYVAIDDRGPTTYHSRTP